jgi:hypothetical protein
MGKRYLVAVQLPAVPEVREARIMECRERLNDEERQIAEITQVVGLTQGVVGLTPPAAELQLHLGASAGLRLTFKKAGIVP